MRIQSVSDLVVSGGRRNGKISTGATVWELGPGCI